VPTMTGTATAPDAPAAHRPATSGVLPSTRVASVDGFRGFVMFLMLAEALRLWTLHDAFPASRVWAIVAYNTTHVPWQGCSLHDLIQPAFSFLVGVSLPFSIASRRARGDSFGALLAHAVRRSLVLILLGIVLRSLGRTHTYWTFEDTLTQIGLGYTFLFLLAFARVRTQAIVFAALLVGFWTAFVLYPLPPPGFDYPGVGVPAGWPHLYSGFLAHFNKNANLSWAFDVWFLNLFPREAPFRFNSGGWSTLSCVPTLATMILGLWAGQWIRTPRTPRAKLTGLVAAGVALALTGLVLQALHINPIVKRIWTSSYTLYSGGLVVLMLAAFYAVMDVRGWTRWAFPLLVIGANSIAAYVMSWTLESFVSEALVRHLGPSPFAVLGPPFAPVLRGFAVLLVFWLILYWMYRRRIFLRI
jgi:heparan-alpha-glucosaminide N-acetyltransferase